MKNVDELYEKYCNAYKNNYAADDISEAKKNYKQFELFHKTDKKLTLDGETKIFFKEIENRKRNVDRKGVYEIF